MPRTRTYLDEIVVDVPTGNALPRIGDKLYCSSVMTGLTYEMTVKSIRGVKWTDEGVSVTVRGSKRVAQDVPGLN